jgi:t-SNARE complex subunit (syntaxin)
MVSCLPSLHARARVRRYVDLATEAAALKETFQDLNQLTKEQGEPLAEIAGKIEDAATASGSGAKSLTSAAKNKGKTRCKVLILIAILTVVALVILLIILQQTGVLRLIYDSIVDDINKKKKNGNRRRLR